MISLEIFKLDYDDKPISTLKIGEHVFGRGTLLECDDRRVSRNHGLITITNDKASITSTHQNPCFYISANSETITILPKDSPVCITDGDKFALLADQFWYKIKFKLSTDELSDTNGPEINYTTDMEMNGSDNCNGPVETLKRPCDDDQNNENKKCKVFDSNMPPNSCDEQACGRVKQEALSDSEDKLNSSEERQSNQLKMEPEAVDESVRKDEHVSDMNPEATASTSLNKRPWRDYCIYGIQCYRKSAAHLTEYSHPGDSDYESDPNDQRPVCSYGNACYRKNKNHRESYKHPRGTDDSKKPAGPRPPKRDTKKTYRDESSEDDYDMDDPFMADSSSEFEFDGLSDETDSESSGVGEEGVVKRLVKEAKRFIRPRKKD